MLARHAGIVLVIEGLDDVIAHVGPPRGDCSIIWIPACAGMTVLMDYLGSTKCVAGVRGG